MIKRRSYREGIIIIPVLVLVVLAIALGLLVYKSQNFQSQANLTADTLPSPNSEVTLTPEPTITATPTLAPTSSPIPTKSPTPKPTGTPKPSATAVPISTGPVGAGYSKRNVQTDRGVFTVYIVGADLGSTKVIVDTASGGDCANNCPVLSLGDYVARNGAYAGINGSYFCPETYPSCADKKNSFDTLLMNKDKVYFNSANNVYSTVPAVIFQGGSVRFVQQSLEWGRDTGVDGVLANYPLLVFNSNNMQPSSGDSKLTAKGTRSFVANKDNMIFIGAVANASVNDSAAVLHAMGMQNALNLDSGGSTALWSGGYKLGPGRNLPNVILFKTK